MYVHPSACGATTAAALMSFSHSGADGLDWQWGGNERVPLLRNAYRSCSTSRSSSPPPSPPPSPSSGRAGGCSVALTPGPALVCAAARGCAHTTGQRYVRYLYMLCVVTCNGPVRCVCVICMYVCMCINMHTCLLGYV